eukprot:4834666-Alexandrium_andersonii.AAC.1
MLACCKTHSSHLWETEGKALPKSVKTWTGSRSAGRSRYADWQPPIGRLSSFRRCSAKSKCKRAPNSAGERRKALGMASGA